MFERFSDAARRVVVFVEGALFADGRPGSEIAFLSNSSVFPWPWFGVQFNGSSFGSITGAQVVPGTNNQTVRFTFSGLTSTGQLTTYMRPGSVGTPNGEPNDTYTADYTLTSFGFNPVKPLGSLIYSGSATGSTYTFALDAGQSVTVVATGGTPTVTLRGPAGETPLTGSIVLPEGPPSACVFNLLATKSKPAKMTITLLTR